MENEYNYDSDFWGEKISSRRGGHRRSRRKQRKKRRALSWLLVLLIFFVAFMYAGYTLSNSWLDEGVKEKDREDRQGLVDPAKDRTLTLLLMGVDRRDEEVGRSDTIIVAFVNLDKKTVNLLSIPRDTYTSVPGHGRTKINHAYAYGGVDLLKAAVEGLLGVDIQRYVQLDFQGFVNVVDLLGGVEVDVRQDMYYPEENIDLKKGRQTLHGEDALAYVRYRGDGRGDIGRIERQQKFLRLLLDKLLNVQTLWKVPELAREVNRYVATDLTLKGMITLVKELKDISPENLKVATLPGKPVWIDNISYWQPDYTAMQEILDEFQDMKKVAVQASQMHPQN